MRKFRFLKFVMVLGCTKCILEEFWIFLKMLKYRFIIVIPMEFFDYSLGIFYKDFRIFRPKMGTKWPNLPYGTPWKTQILRKPQFLKVVMVLGCPKCILEEFRIYCWKLLIFPIFALLSHWPFPARVLKFYSKYEPEWHNLVSKTLK